MSDSEDERVIFLESKTAAFYCLSHLVQGGVVKWGLDADRLIEASSKYFHILNLVEVE